MQKFIKFTALTGYLSSAGLLLLFHGILLALSLYLTHPADASPIVWSAAYLILLIASDLFLMSLGRQLKARTNIPLSQNSLQPISRLLLVGDFVSAIWQSIVMILVVGGFLFGFYQAGFFSNTDFSTPNMTNAITIGATILGYPLILRPLYYRISRANPDMLSSGAPKITSIDSDGFVVDMLPNAIQLGKTEPTQSRQIRFEFKEIDEMRVLTLEEARMLISSMQGDIVSAADTVRQRIAFLAGSQKRPDVWLPATTDLTESLYFIGPKLKYLIPFQDSPSIESLLQEFRVFNNGHSAKQLDPSKN